MPHYALYIELALAAWIGWQIFTGKLVYKKFPTLRRQDDPKAFWLGITVQALPTLGGLCVSTGFVAGIWVIGFLYAALFLTALICLPWIIARGVRQYVKDPRVAWERRKYPRMYWFFMTYRPQRAAVELEALLLECPGDGKTIRMLAVAYEQMGKQDMARDLQTELAHAEAVQG